VRGVTGGTCPGGDRANSAIRRTRSWNAVAENRSPSPACRGGRPRILASRETADRRQPSRFGREPTRAGGARPGRRPSHIGGRWL